MKIDGIPWNFHHKNHPAMGVPPLTVPSKELGPWAPRDPWGPGPGHISCYTALDVAWHLGIGAELMGKEGVRPRKSWGF